MIIDNRIVKALNESDFSNWYSGLSRKFSSDQSLEDYEDQSVKLIFDKLNIDYSYNSKENFYKLLRKSGTVELQINLSLKYGVIELILGVTQNGDRIKVGGPFSFMFKKLNNGKKVLPARFKDYYELEEIISSTNDFISIILENINDELEK